MFMAQACKDAITCVVAEHKKRRVPGEPRHLIDCYLDELQKVSEKYIEENGSTHAESLKHAAYFFYASHQHQWQQYNVMQILLSHPCIACFVLFCICLITILLFQPKGEDPSFSEKHLLPYIIDLHFAATDTTSNTLLTGFLYLMTYPHIQGMVTHIYFYNWLESYS